MVETKREGKNREKGQGTLTIQVCLYNGTDKRIIALMKGQKVR